MGYKLLGDLRSSSKLDQYPNPAYNNKHSQAQVRSIDFVLVFPQTDLNVNMYMELPIDIDAPNGGNRDYVLKLNKYIYGLKQASKNWFETLKAGLYPRYFEQTASGPMCF